MTTKELKTFYITFGYQYSYLEHPKAINDVYPHPDGWMTLEATNFGHALLQAKEVFGDTYSNIYTEEQFSPEFYPKGLLGELGEVHIELRPRH